jgi:AcrR family transcriptional regulator
VTEQRVRRKRRGAYHHGDLRRALLDESIRTIRDDGVDALTLRAAGAKLGVSRTALYRHFADKGALLTAVATEGFRMLRERLREAWSRHGGGRSGFDEMGRAYVAFAAANPAHYRVMFGGFVRGRGDGDLERESQDAFQALVEALAAQQRDGLVRDDDPVALARFVWAVVHGVAMLVIDRQLHDEVAATMAEYAIERVHSGIGVVKAAAASEDADQPPRRRGHGDARRR